MAEASPGFRSSTRSVLTLCAWLAALTLFFVTVTTINLANYRPISGDDMWILSASYKLATTGVLGSDMYAGFAGAERYYFIALPGQHLLQALVLNVAGAGIVQARWVSVAGGGVLLWVVSLLAWSWYGPGVAILTSALLLFWQPAFVGEQGVPLVTLARSLRYDLTAVVWMWLSYLFLDRFLQRATRWRALAAGLCAGAAALTQFFGAIAVAVVVVGWAVQRYGGRSTGGRSDWLLVGCCTIITPYLLHVAAHARHAWQQTVYLKGSRADFGLEALVANLYWEPLRYEPLFNRPVDVGLGLLFVAVVPALAYLGYRILRCRTRGDQFLGLILPFTLLLLALVDQTKAPLYALPLLPPLCIAVALFLQRLWLHAWSSRFFRRNVLAVGVVAAIGLVLWDGAAFYRQDWRQALTVSDYDVLSEAINAAVSANSLVVGDERWWWPRREQPYLALNNLRLQWELMREQSDQTPQLAALFRALGVDYIIVTEYVRADMQRAPRGFSDQFWLFLEQCTRLHRRWADPWYGDIMLHALHPHCVLDETGGASGGRLHIRFQVRMADLLPARVAS